ncbi:MAG: prolyl aminopeptidase [Rhodocyclaceae bacterium]|nr:prolyl aminopeptidase [Rhodocyclaceae bacterium]MBX3669997.1 prolyl aminopeptidase [Rhodocyclaceae bacterium]
MNPKFLRYPLYPPVEPYDQGWLEVGEGHRIYYEQCGNPRGLPALFLHGGPGSGCTPQQRRFFDPLRYRVVLFDQRGCGRSEPRGATHANTTAHLVRDIERLRAHLGVQRWLVFGGSWGSTLALAYAAAQRAACLGLILRGIFLAGKDDTDWLFRDSAQYLPDHWAEFSALAPGQHLLHYCMRAIAAGPPERAIAAVRAWVRYEEAAMRFGQPDAAVQAPPDTPEENARLLDKYRVQAHYLTQDCFFGEDQLLTEATRMGALPTVILHGRLDMVCRPQAAWRLHRALPGSRLYMAGSSGHSPFDTELSAGLVSSTAHFAEQGNFTDWQFPAS